MTNDYITTETFKTLTMSLQNCAVNSISVYQPTTAKPWNVQQIFHLYNRLGFGATLTEVEAALALSPEQLVDQLLDGVVAMPPPAAPPWANFTMADYNGDDDLIDTHRRELTGRWLLDMHTEGVRSKLALFWHNHFVTELQVYGCNAYLWAYYDLLHQSTLGNFRSFVEAIGKTPAMLSYLNGNENIAAEPNENYARELMELFTMGEGNGYTQSDIEEVARALTGWRADDYECTPPFFDSNLFDDTPKTIFGQTGNWNYDDVHELIFTLRRDQVARYICTKIYEYFVYPEINSDIVNNLAATFKQNNFELLPVFKQLFKSEHFFDETLFGARIKSPIESFARLIKGADLSFPADYITDSMDFISYASRELGQELFNPVDVAGWPGQRTWINENTLTFRWSFGADLLANYFTDSGKEKLVALALALSNGSNDPQLIVQMVAAHFINVDLGLDAIETAVQYFKGDIPENYFADGSWNLYWDEASDQMVNLLAYLIRLPEYQLS